MGGIKTIWLCKIKPIIRGKMRQMNVAELLSGPAAHVCPLLAEQLLFLSENNSQSLFYASHCRDLQ